MADIDYSKLSDAELNKLIVQTRAEISSSKPKEESSGGKSVSELSDKELNDMIRNTRREALREEGAASVKESMKAPPEYIEVPAMGPDGTPTGYTEKVLKPSKADPIGRGALSVLPFGEDIGAYARSTGGFGIPPSGRTMSEEKDVMQGEKEAAKEAYATPFMVGQAAGIVPQLYLPFGLAGRGTTALGKTALGAAEGAGYGAVTGFGEGSTLEERLQAAKSGALVGGTVSGTQAIMYALAPSLYPKAIRGTGLGVAVAIGRGGSAVGPLLGAALVGAGRSPSQVLMVLLPIIGLSGLGALIFVALQKAQNRAQD
jgi:hypothetical protein